jgi:RNA polymerase sigma factor (sigma-70 family)
MLELAGAIEMTASNATIGHNLVRLFKGGSVAGLGEAELLNHVAHRDALAESAFEAILTRHGPAVLASCRRALGDSAAADDAFQAAFLVLFRHAGSIRVEEKVLPWLLHVARMAALKARESELRRRARERSVARPEAVAPDIADNDLRLLVRAEVDCLPAKYREPVRLCYLEGRTHDTAAAALGWPVGTVRGRLSRARDMLRKRLMRRGVGITPVVLTAAMASAADARAELPWALREATITIAAHGTATKAGVLAVATAVGRNLAVATAVKAAAVGLAVVGLIGASVGIAAVAGRDASATRENAVSSKEPAIRAAAVDRYGDPLPKGAIARLGTIRFRFQGQGGRTFLTPDGKALITASAGGRADVWDIATGRLLRSIAANEALLAPDGKTLFVADTGVLRAVDFFDGRELRRVETGLPGNPEQLIGSPDGKSLGILVSHRFVNANRMPQTRWTVTVYDGATLTKRFQLEKENGLTRDLVFSSDGRVLAVAGSDEGERGILTEPTASWIHLYDAATGAKRRQIAIDGFGVASVGFSLDGKTLAAGVGDRTIRLYDPATGEERLPRLGHEIALPPRKPGERLHKDYDRAWAAGCLAFSPDGKTLASGTEGLGWFSRPSDIPPIRLWDLASAHEIRKFAGHPIGCVSLAFTPDGKTLASSGFEPLARLWDVATGQEIGHRPGHASYIQGLAVSPADGTVFTVSLEDGPVLHWNPSDGRLIENLGAYPTVINNIAISPDGKTLLFINQDPNRESVLWNVMARKEVGRLAYDKSVWWGNAAFSPDGRLIAGGYRIWDAATGRLITKFATEDDRNWCLPAFSADGRQVITVESSRVSIWDVATGKEVRRAVERIPMANNTAISPDGRFVAVGQKRFGTEPESTAESPEHLPDRLVDPIRIWEVASGKEVATLYGHTDASIGLAFSPDGRMVASVSGAWQNRKDPGLRVWDVASGRPLRRFKNNPGGGFRVAFLPDGRSIITSNTDGAALVWDVSDLAERRASEPLDAKALEALWLDLASDDAVRAFRASWALSVSDAVPYLRDRLLSAAVDRAGQPAFALEKHAAFAERKATKSSAPRLSDPSASPEVLRSLRAIAALERAGNASARQILESLARSDQGPPVAQHAAAALLRLSQPQRAVRAAH